MGFFCACFGGGAKPDADDADVKTKLSTGDEKAPSSAPLQPVAVTSVTVPVTSAQADGDLHAAAKEVDANNQVAVPPAHTAAAAVDAPDATVTEEAVDVAIVNEEPSSPVAPAPAAAPLQIAEAAEAPVQAAAEAAAAYVGLAEVAAVPAVVGAPASPVVAIRTPEPRTSTNKKQVITPVAAPAMGAKSPSMAGDTAAATTAAAAGAKKELAAPKKSPSVTCEAVTATTPVAAALPAATTAAVNKSATMPKELASRAAAQATAKSASMPREKKPAAATQEASDKAHHKSSLADRPAFSTSSRPNKVQRGPPHSPTHVAQAVTPAPAAGAPTAAVASSATAALNNIWCGPDDITAELAVKRPSKGKKAEAVVTTPPPASKSYAANATGHAAEAGKAPLQQEFTGAWHMLPDGSMTPRTTVLRSFLPPSIKKSQQQPGVAAAVAGAGGKGVSAGGSDEGAKKKSKPKAHYKKTSHGKKRV